MSFLFGRPPPSNCETEAAAAARHTAVMNQLSALMKAVNGLVQSQATQTTILGKIMSDIDNLTAAITALSTAVAAADAAIETELAAIAAANTGNNPAIAAAVTNIQALTDALTAETAKVTTPTP